MDGCSAARPSSSGCRFHPVSAHSPGTYEPVIVAQFQSSSDATNAAPAAARRRVAGGKRAWPDKQMDDGRQHDDVDDGVRDQGEPGCERERARRERRPDQQDARDEPDRDHDREHVEAHEPSWLAPDDDAQHRDGEQQAAQQQGRIADVRRRRSAALADERRQHGRCRAEGDARREQRPDDAARPVAANADDDRQQGDPPHENPVGGVPGLGNVSGVHKRCQRRRARRSGSASLR